MKAQVTVADHISDIRRQFPVLNQNVNGNPLIYLDNAATTQKPLRVIEALEHYYKHDNANIHRGIHTLAERATRAFEETRREAQQFINAPETEEIIFTRGVTESINLVASSWGRTNLQPGDEIVLSGLEHHSNIVPWQMIAAERGAIIRVIPVSDSGELDLDRFQELLSDKTKMVAVNHASNSLGTINPVEEIIRLAHEAGALVLIDGAQAVAHLTVDVRALDCDFYCASAHKMYGPTGVGILYGKRKLLDAMPPYQGGGEMIREVSFSVTTYNSLPYKFEAGTPNIADIIAFREAIRFVRDMQSHVPAFEHELLTAATAGLKAIPGLRLIGTATNKVSVQSFLVQGIHPFDMGQMLDAKGIAVRTGHHCTQPLMDRFGIEGTVRASFAVYNTLEEVEKLVAAVHRIVKFMA